MKQSAKEINIGTVLYTKKSKEIGNAIVTDIIGDVYIITTDYGNKAKFLYQELLSLFEIGKTNIKNKYITALFNNIEREYGNDKNYYDLSDLEMSNNNNLKYYHQLLNTSEELSASITANKIDVEVDILHNITKELKDIFFLII